MGAHAKKSASGAKRWLACPGSIELTDRLPKAFRSRSGDAARLGTAAHGLGEHCLVKELRSSRSLKGRWIGLDADEDAHVLGDLSEQEYALAEQQFPHLYEIDDDMMDAVDVYLETVWGILDSVEGAELFVEKRFNLQWLRPDMFGTGDAAIFQFLGRLYVIDYKHGQGVPVEVEEDGEFNKQLGYYGVGLAQEMDWLFEDVELIVVQPRCPHPDGPVRSTVITKQQLLAYADELAEGSDLVEDARKDPYRYLKAGKHCGFCPVGPTCPEQLRNTQNVAAMDFEDDPFDLEPPVLDGTDEALRKLGRILEWKPKIDAFLRAADALSQRLLEQGQVVPGHKLVRKKTNRKFKTELDAADIAEKLVEAKLFADFDDAFKAIHGAPKLKSPAQIEKLGKAAKLLVNGVFDKEKGVWVVDPMCFKPEGGLTMAHEWDPREAVQVDAASDFADDDLDEGEV